MENSISRIKLFVGPQQPQQLISDLDLWTTLYQKMASVEDQYVHGINDTIEFIDERLKPHMDVVQGDCKIRASNGKCQFLHDVLAIRSTLDTKLVTAAANYERFVKDANDLKKFKDEDKNMSIELKYRKKTFKDMHKTYSKYKAVTEERKFRYQRAALEAEKLEIDILHERREKFLREMTREAEHQQRKAERDELRYKVAVDKAQEKFDILKDAAARYEDAFTRQETYRAELILQTLSDGGQNFGVDSSGNNGCPLFENVDTHALTNEASRTGAYKVHEFEVFSKSLLHQLQKRSKDREDRNDGEQKSKKLTKSGRKTKVSDCADTSDEYNTMRARRKKSSIGSVKENNNKGAVDVEDESKRDDNDKARDDGVAEDGARKVSNDNDAHIARDRRCRV